MHFMIHTKPEGMLSPHTTQTEQIQLNFINMAQFSILQKIHGLTTDRCALS